MEPIQGIPDLAREVETEDTALRRYVRGFLPRSIEAQDVAQETWLAALEGRATRLWRNPQGWLRVVARRIVHHEHARAELRAHSELAAARDARERSRTGSPQHEREAALRALAALEEPYRSVLRLRFFEELTTEEIARELGRSHATVRSQLQRGIALVRDRMSPRQRAERRWGLLAWLRGTRAEESASRLALPSAVRALLAVVLVAGAFWLGLRLAAPDPSAGTALAAVAVEPARSLDEGAGPLAAVRGLDAPGAAREALGVAPASPTTVSASSARVPRTLEIRVADPHGRPIAGAEVSVVTRASSLLRGLSDERGRCRVELSALDAGAYGIPGTLGRVTLRASSPAHAASALLHVPLEQCDGRTLDLTLGGPPLVLAGRVVDAAGRAVEGAFVSAGGDGSFVPPPGENVFESPWLPETRTGADGSFAIAGLLREPQYVRVFAEGFAERLERIAPTDGIERFECTLVLRGGATLSGTVRGPDGEPAAQALVFAEPVDRPSVWSARLAGYDARLAGVAPCTTTDENGQFRLQGILAGTRRLWATRAGDVASSVLELDPDLPATWDPRLEAGHGLALRVLDERGAPCAGLRVRMRCDGLPDEWVIRIEATDEEGRVRIPDCLDPVASVEVLDERLVAQLARATNLAPGPEEHVIVVPERNASMGIVRGVLLGADGFPLGAAELKRYDTQSHSSVALHVDRSSGRFEQALLPGRFLLACIVERRGFSFGEHELEAGETLDVGVLRAPGTGMLMLVRGALPGLAARPDSFRLSTRYDASGPSVFRELLRGSWPPPEELELFPGHHWLEVFDESGGVMLRADAEITASGTAWMDLP